MAEIKIQCPMRGVEIVHAIPGRVRLSSLRTTQRLHNFNKSTETLQELSQQLQQQPGIKKIQINPESKSALILFEERILPLQTLLLTLQAMGVEDGRNNPPTLPLSEPLELAKNALASASQLDTVIPYMVGMVLTQQLGITGLPALPFYLIAAGTTKQVLEEYNETETQQTPSPEYRLAHSVPGRLRYEIKRLVEDEVYARRLERKIRDMAAITGVRINRSNASLVVLYNHRLLTLEQIKNRIEDVIHPTTVGTPASVTKPRETEVTAEIPTLKTQKPVLPSPTPKPSLNTFNQTNGFWSQYKPPALKMCLAFLARL
ncbi:MAG TPA: hypothetical protein V6D13_18280 [Halomicronema sp.]